MPSLKNIRISRKYSFALLGILLAIGILPLMHSLNWPEHLTMYSIISTHVVILIITITYLTGQAKIDIEAVYGKRPFDAVHPVITSPSGDAK